MTVYGVGFAVSVLLIYYAESRRFQGRESHVCMCLSLLIPCAIAGLRHHTIGTDVQVYVEPLFEVARSSDSFWDFYRTEFYQTAVWSDVFVYEFEVGFDVLCYICAKVFNSIPALLFLIQALTVIPIYKGLRGFEKTQPVWLGMTVYYLMFFNSSLNLMRQWVAMAILFWGFQLLQCGKYRKYFCVVLMSMLFHFSAIMGVVIAVIYKMTGDDQSHHKKRNTFILVIFGLIAIFCLDILVYVTSWMGFRYENYISGTISLMPRQLLYRLPIIFLIIVRWKKLKSLNHLACFYTVMIAYDLISSQLISIFVYSGRIGLFFSEYYMLAYPAICKASSSPKNRQALRWFVVSYLCIYWWYVYSYGGSSATVPYKSFIADIMLCG